MGVKLVRKARAIGKGFKYGKKLLNPGTWIDVALDVATDALVGQVERAFEGEDNSGDGSGVEIQNETTYVNNYYVTNKTTVTNITPPTFPPRYNRERPRFFRHNPVTTPQRILPTEIDTQTSFQSPVGQSINVGAQTTLDKYEYGKLIFNPLSTNKTLLKRKPLTDKGKFLTSYQNAQQEAIRAIDKQTNEEPLPVQYTGYLITPQNLAGLSGDGKVLMGINSISVLAQTYRTLSSYAYIEPSNEIPTKYEELDVNTNLTDLVFNGTAVPIANSDDLWSLLGYEDEEEFEEKSIEDVIKDFGEKIYENKQLKKVDDKVLFPIKENFANTEQLLVGLMASLFYRQGLHRLPGELPESLLFDNTKYKKPEDQPTIFIEDSLEYQEYLLKNLDALMGQFPINFKVKVENDKGQPEEKEVNFPNISETLTEIIGTLLGVAKDSDTAVAVSIKNLIETVKCSNLALTAVDTARANADYLGYKANEIERTVLVPFNPNATSVGDFLKDTELKITSFDNVDDNTLTEQLKLLSIAAQITKNALAQRKSFITGDAITERRKQDKEKYDEDWEQILEKYNGATTNSQTQTATKPFPNAKIKDKSINTNNP